MNDERTIRRATAAIQLLKILATRPDWRHGYRLRYLWRMARTHVFCAEKRYYRRGNGELPLTVQSKDNLSAFR